MKLFTDCISTASICLSVRFHSNFLNRVTFELGFLHMYNLIVLTGVKVKVRGQG